MHFKSLKYKFSCKGYHSSAQKSATSFFDSSYQYLKQNQGLVNLDTTIPQHQLLTATPHPVVVANVNYNNVERALQYRQEFDLQRIDYDDPHLVYEKDGELYFYYDQSDAARRKSRRGSQGAGAGVPVPKKERSNSFSYLANEKSALINKKLSNRYYSTTTTSVAGKGLKINVVGADVVPPEEKKGSIRVPDAFLQKLKDSRLDDSIPAWEADKELCLNKHTFLETQSRLIDDCVKSREYNKVNAIYQSLKRNAIVPPIHVFEQVLMSICKRDLDENNIDNQMFELLNCYQDIIQHRLKPSIEIYHIVVGALLSGSIKGFELHNANGLDFFKIAIDLFFASNLHHSKSFNPEFLDTLLLAINLYPGHVKYNYIKNFIDSNNKYVKNEIYYISLLSYAKMLNEGDAVKDLYQVFRAELPNSPQLVEHQYEVYAVVLSALAETGSLALATRLLDRLLKNLQSKDGHAKNSSLVLSNFLISVGKINPDKAFQLLMEFSKLKWVPQFSYEFYLVMIANSLNTNWEVVKKLYSLIFPMRTAFTTVKNENKIKNYLLYPSGLESMPSTILTYALRQKDDEMVMKLVEESIVKKYSFQMGLYPYIFKYFKSINCPEPYLLRFIKATGDVLSESKNDKNKSSLFDLLNALVENYQSQSLLSNIPDMPFFNVACGAFSLENTNTVNYAGFIVCFQNLWKTPQVILGYARNLNLHGLVITKLYDLDTYYCEVNNKMLLEFKSQIAERFEKLCLNYKRLHLGARKVDPITVQAMKMVDVSEDTVNYFQHPGDWNKTYPLSLGPMLRNSKATGLKQYERLSKDGYTFDYDTFSQLLHLRYVTPDVITRTIDTCPDEKTLCYISNTIVVRCSRYSLDQTVLNHPLFEEKILKNLTDKSLTRLGVACPDPMKFAEKISFPDRFKSIASQAEFKSTIECIYDSLFRNKKYSTILGFNAVVPCLNASILLKSLIRVGEYEKFLSLWNKFKSSFTPEQSSIFQAEYLINQKKSDEAIEVLRAYEGSTNHEIQDLHSFAVFLSSFSGGDPKALTAQKVQNTLQLANTISAQNSLHDMIHSYETLTEGKLFSDDSKCNYSVKLEISQQILNNIEDSLQFFDMKNSTFSSAIIRKLESFLKFRGYLCTNSFSNSEMLQLLKIWNAVDPVKVDSLFNNIVESICLNNEIDCIYFDQVCYFKVNKMDLFKILDCISDLYKAEDLAEHQSKVENFKEIISSTMK